MINFKKKLLLKIIQNYYQKTIVNPGYYDIPLCTFKCNVNKTYFLCLPDNLTYFVQFSSHITHSLTDLDEATAENGLLGLAVTG